MYRAAAFPAVPFTAAVPRLDRYMISTELTDYIVLFKKHFYNLIWLFSARCGPHPSLSQLPPIFFVRRERLNRHNAYTCHHQKHRWRIHFHQIRQTQMADVPANTLPPDTPNPNGRCSRKGTNMLFFSEKVYKYQYFP